MYLYLIVFIKNIQFKPLMTDFFGTLPIRTNFPWDRTLFLLTCFDISSMYTQHHLV